MQPKCKEFKACVAQDKTLVHKGDVFAYNNHYNEVRRYHVTLLISIVGLQVHRAEFSSLSYSVQPLSSKTQGCRLESWVLA